MSALAHGREDWYSAPALTGGAEGGERNLVMLDVRAGECAQPCSTADREFDRAPPRGGAGVGTRERRTGLGDVARLSPTPWGRSRRAEAPSLRVGGGKPIHEPRIRPRSKRIDRSQF